MVSMLILKTLTVTLIELDFIVEEIKRDPEHIIQNLRNLLAKK